MTNSTLHVVFAAPFFLDATLAFLRGTAQLPNIVLSVISQDPAEKIPPGIRSRIAAHWQVRDGLDSHQLLDGVRRLSRELGSADRLIGPLEQLQVPLAEVREALNLPGLSVAASHNFRDKSLMKQVLTAAGVPCARHTLVTSPEALAGFAREVGFPLIIKPTAGAGGTGTLRIDNPEQLALHLSRWPVNPQNPIMVEEYVRGEEHSFDSVVIDSRPVWFSISRYMPSPLEVMENDWIQWCVVLPREVSGPDFSPIREAGFRGVQALGLTTGLSHLEWFRLPSGGIAVSEVGARPPGAQFTSLLSYAHDIDFYEAWPRLLVHNQFEPPQRRYACGAAYIRGQGKGRVLRIHGIERAQAKYGGLVVEAKLPKQGQRPSSSYEGDGYVIVRHPDTEVVEEALWGLVRTLRVELG
ncbi:MAG: ATP-grasp domain-containing protein [Pseudomonadota bacterium]